MANRKNTVRIGEKIGLLTVLSVDLIDGTRYATCSCQCGVQCRRKTQTVRKSRSDSPPSCGCATRQALRDSAARARDCRDPEKLVASGKKLRNRIFVDPTPAEIAERCEEIRQEWGPERWAKYHCGVNLQVVRTSPAYRAAEQESRQ